MQKKIDSIVVGMIETNCWLYRLEAQSEPFPCIVIDPGDDAGAILSRLKENNWVPVYILLTHGHFDHILALPGLMDAFEKGFFGDSARPKVGIHSLDAQYIGSGAFSTHKKVFSAAGEDSSSLNPVWKPMPEADIAFEEGDSVGPFKVLHIPGHTRGSIGLYDEKENVLFSGDTLFKGDWGRTDLPGGSEEEIQQSLKRLLSLKEETAVYPGHGPATSIREERAKFN